ncbi:MAG: hypothetical protein AAF676_04365 [Pseudomonadota bacterium]
MPQRLAVGAVRKGDGASHGAHVTALTTLVHTPGMFRVKQEQEKPDRLSRLMDIIGEPGSKAWVTEH